MSSHSPLGAVIVAVIALLMADGMCSAETNKLKPTSGTGDYTHSSWGRRDGAPTSVVGLAQTRDHFLWLASAGGLYRFDGLQFQKYPFNTNEPPLLSTEISSVAADDQGGLWVGYSLGGATYLRDGLRQDYGPADGMLGGATTQFICRPDGSVWSLSGGSIKKLERNRWVEFGATHGLSASPVYAMHFDRQGNLWAASHRKIQVLEHGAETFRAYRTQTLAVYQFFDDPSGHVWITDSWRTVRPIDTPKGGYPLQHPAQAVAGPDGDLWIALNYPGVIHTTFARMNMRGNFALPVFTDLSSPGTRSILRDDCGNIWVGTNGGVDRFAPSPFHPYRDTPLLYFPSLATTRDGSVLIGGHDVPVVRTRDGVTTQTAIQHGMGSIFVDAEDRIWMQDARMHGLRGVLGTNVMTLPEIVQTDPTASVQAIGRDTDGSLLASLEGHGLWRYTTRWENVTLPEAPGETPLSILRVADGSVWLGFSNNRVLHKTQNSSRMFGPKDGLSVGAVVTLHEHGGLLWLSGPDGVCFLTQGILHALKLNEADRLTGTSGIVQDEKGDAWFNAQVGVVHVPAAELQKVIASSEYRADSDVYDEHQGVLGTPAQLRPLPSAVMGKDQTLWFATVDHLVSLNAEKIGPDPAPVRPRITSIVVNGQALPATDLEREIQLDAKSLRTLEIDYLAVQLSAGERTRYRYMMEGVDRGWQQAGSRRQAFYMHLAPGSYRFRVMATDGYGFWTEAGTALQLHIRPAFYQTRLFQVLLAGTGILLLWSLIRLRIVRATSALRSRAAAQIAERERIARVLHDTLLQGMQGLILSFQAIAEEPSLEWRTKARIEKTLERTQEVLDEARANVHELRNEFREGVDLTEALQRVALSVADNTLRIRTEQLGDGMQLIPSADAAAYYIGKEALHNAVKHAAATTITIRLHFEESGLLLCIKDDGKGITPEMLKHGKEGHWGLAGMRERARSAGGTLRISSREDHGTEVSLRLPAKTAYVESQ